MDRPEWLPWPDLTGKQRKALLLTALVLGSVATGALVVFAASTFLDNSVPVRGPTSFKAPTGPAVTLDYDADVNMTDMSPDDQTLVINSSEGNITVRGDNWANVTVDDPNGTYTNTSDIEAVGRNVEINPYDKPAVNVTGELDTLKFTSMTIDDGSVDFIYSASTAGANLTVRGMPADVRIGARDVDGGDVIATGSTDANGKGNLTDLPAGTYPISIEQAPETIDIRDENEPHGLIDNAAVEILASGSGETVDRQTTTNGKVDLAGLPTDEEYVVVVDAPGYHLRQIIVEDLFDQSTVFVLNQTNTSVENAFFVQDNTGRYDEPKLVIDKAINRSIYDPNADSGYQWTTIGGDRLGADSRLVIDLKKSDRYRISVENQDGDRRILGEYTAATNGTVTLTVGEITWENPTTGDGYQIEAYQHDPDGSPEQVIIQYEDETEGTSEFCVEIYEEGNQTNILYPEDCVTNIGTYKATIPVTGDDANTTWVANWSATVNGTAVGSTIPLTGIRELPIPIDPKWLGAGVYVLLIGGLAATPKASARTGALLITVFAFGLTWWGWVPIPLPALALAGAVALLGKVADFNNPY